MDERKKFELRNIMPHMRKPAGAQNQQFPGLSLDPDATIESIRSFIKKQKKIKGFLLAVPGSSTQTFDIQISGDARLLLGISIVNTSANAGNPAVYPDQFTMMVNEEVIINQVFGIQLSFPFQTDEYYFIPRPLSGQDVVSCTLRNPSIDAQTTALAVYYL